MPKILPIPKIIPLSTSYLLHTFVHSSNHCCLVNVRLASIRNLLTRSSLHFQVRNNPIISCQWHIPPACTLRCGPGVLNSHHENKIFWLDLFTIGPICTCLLEWGIYFVQWCTLPSEIICSLLFQRHSLISRFKIQDWFIFYTSKQYIIKE